MALGSMTFWGSDPHDANGVHLVLDGALKMGKFFNIAGGDALSWGQLVGWAGSSSWGDGVEWGQVWGRREAEAILKRDQETIWGLGQ